MPPMQNAYSVCPFIPKSELKEEDRPCIPTPASRQLSIKMIMPSDDPDGPKQCAVCGKSALCYNFGVMSCDACKMFFRRTVVLNVKYECRRNNQCFEKNFSCLKSPYCRACRFTQCVKVGMRLSFENFMEIRNKDEKMMTLIGRLLYQDAKREKALVTHFTFDNPSLEDIVESRKCLIVMRDPSQEMTSSDWCFFGAYTAVKFLLNLDFMKELDSKDKVTLLANFSAKATLLFSALRTMKAKNDKMIKPDGNDFFNEFLSKWSHFSLHFTNRVRSLLVNRLIELNITNEEFILVTVVFFCNPALDNLSESTRAILGKEQHVYSDALMKYCLTKYQQNGPSRFTDLLSLCHVTNKYFVDVQYLYWIFEFQFHVQYKKLVSGVI